MKYLFISDPFMVSSQTTPQQFCRALPEHPEHTGDPELPGHAEYSGRPEQYGHPEPSKHSEQPEHSVP